MSADLEWTAVVRPGEWGGGAVVVADEVHDAGDEFVSGRELAAAQQFAEALVDELGPAGAKQWARDLTDSLDDAG